MDPERFELSTFSMPLRRAPNCAMGPYYSNGPGGIRTLDLFSAIEARSQLRYRPVLHPDFKNEYSNVSRRECQGLYCAHNANVGAGPRPAPPASVRKIKNWHWKAEIVIYVWQVTVVIALYGRTVPHALWNGTSHIPYEKLRRSFADTQDVKKRNKISQLIELASSELD